MMSDFQHLTKSLSAPLKASFEQSIKFEHLRKLCDEYAVQIKDINIELEFNTGLSLSSVGALQDRESCSMQI